jgi:hypothetical protein
MSQDNFWAHFHLLVNDVPVIGFFFAALFLIAALTMPDRDSWARGGMLIIGVSFLGMVLTFFSGDPALKVIDGQQRTSGSALSQHHIRGLVASAFALTTIVITVVAALKARRSGGAYSRTLLITVLISTLLSVGALAWTGQAGGRINHFELQDADDRKSEPAHPH